MSLTKFQKLMLLNAQPVKFWLNNVGGGIALFFLWNHAIMHALIFGGGIILFGTVLSAKISKTPPEELAKTNIGSIFLRYSTKFGFTCYLISHTLIPLSIWMHNFILTAAGLLALIIGAVKINKQHIAKQ